MSRDQWVAFAYALSFVLMFVLGMLTEMLRRAIVGK